MRVIGSHAISTRPLASFTGVVATALPPGLLVAGDELLAGDTPLGFLVDGLLRQAPQGADGRAVQPARHGRHPGSRRLVHERHELVGEARHRAADADPADVGATAHPVDPTPLGHVALHDRAPAAQLHDALGRAVLGGELALLVVAGPVAA